MHRSMSWEVHQLECVLSNDHSGRAAVNRGVRMAGWGGVGRGGGLLWPGGELAGRSYPWGAAWNPAEAVLVLHV